ncbi:AraC family transcriptional regulator [Nocardioides sp. AX2bis]|uniref:AraC family transcriptional regulator n=1 Tax=Nocardioides sp. AX2bis TaxID=2653157 RepID=UPI001356772B|nr:helix-turn-helix domain-containing protein [Nocardioides sp. AX2bis]
MRADDVERAHLRDARGWSPPVHRFAPPADLAGVARRYWLPVWSLPAGEVTVQRVLRYPVCLVVVAADYARFYGPATGLSEQELSGSGWACGVMLQPAAGAMVLGDAVSTVTDRVVPLEDVPGLPGGSLVAAVRAALVDDPADAGRQERALAVMDDALRVLPPVDEEGRLVNAVVEHVESDPTVLRVGQVCEAFGIGERALQRLTARRVGLNPKWLVQRRRLQEAAERLVADPPVPLAQVAADLGYADQAHLTRDFHAVTGVTPARYATQRRGG